MTSDIEGSIVLKGPAGDVALVWGPGEKGRARAVPAGKYAVRTTRVVRDGWFLSSTGMPHKFRALRAGETKKLDVADTVHFHGMVKRKDQRLQLGFGIKAADGRGLSVYRDGKRVPVTYRVLSRKGKVLAEGRMNYG